MKILRKRKYYGTKKRELDIDGILLSDYDYHQQKTEWHYHENPYFMYLLHGNVWDANRRIKRTCTVGTLMLHNWDDPHYNEKSTNEARGFHIEFDRSFLSKFEIEKSLLEGSHIIKHPYSHITLNRIYHEFLTNDNFSHLGVESQLLNLCNNSFSAEKSNNRKNPEWVHQMIELIHYSEEDLSLGSLSRILDLHPVYLSRSAHRYLGFTISEYIRMTKVNRSLISMYNRKKSLTEIGYSSGFYDQSHFSSVFKTYLGSTPKYFQKSL